MSFLNISELLEEMAKICKWIYTYVMLYNPYSNDEFIAAFSIGLIFNMHQYDYNNRLFEFCEEQLSTHISLK